MDGYEINFDQVQQQATKLSTTLESLQQQIQKMQNVRSELLSDANWYGPNKMTFQNRFEEYLTSISNLLQSGQDHREKLGTIITTYSNTEQG